MVIDFVARQPEIIRENTPLRAELPLHQIPWARHRSIRLRGFDLGAPDHPVQPVGRHQPFHGAAGYLDALPVRLTPHLAGPIHPVIVCMHPPNLGHQLRIADHPVTGWAALGRIVGARGDRAAALRQHPADRLDPRNCRLSIMS